MLLNPINVNYDPSRFGYDWHLESFPALLRKKAAAAAVVVDSVSPVILSVDVSCHLRLFLPAVVGTLMDYLSGHRSN